MIEDARTRRAPSGRPCASGSRGSDTGRAAGLAGALMANNFVALVFTIVFARLLGASGYGSLGALMAAFTILLVPGSALQATVAREVSAAAAPRDADPAAGVRRWLERLLVCTIGAAVVAILLREPVAALVGVDEQNGRPRRSLPTGALWLALCVQRGALQGLGRYGAVGFSIVGEASEPARARACALRRGPRRHRRLPRHHGFASWRWRWCSWFRCGARSNARVAPS